MYVKVYLLEVRIFSLSQKHLFNLIYFQRCYQFWKFIKIEWFQINLTQRITDGNVFSKFESEKVNLCLKLKFWQSGINMFHKLRMNKLYTAGGKEKFFLKELRANLDLIFKICYNLNEIRKTLSLILFNKDAHDINERDDFLNGFVNVFF